MLETKDAKGVLELAKSRNHGKVPDGTSFVRPDRRVYPIARGPLVYQKVGQLLPVVLAWLPRVPSSPKRAAPNEQLDEQSDEQFGQNEPGQLGRHPPKNIISRSLNHLVYRWIYLLNAARSAASDAITSDWSGQDAPWRCRIVAGVAAEIAKDTSVFVDLCQSDHRVDPVETVTGELFPLCAALKWIGRQGAAVLRSRRVGANGRPLWLWGVSSKILRVPHGRVLILAAWNYPLLLPGVQIAQSLAAGNETFVKPAPGCEAVTQQLVQAFYRAGVPESALVQLDSSPQSAIDSIDQGVDLVVLTGAQTTGVKVMTQLAQSTTASIMELSGCDAMLVHPQADLDQVADAIIFGLTFNSGATCIAPRRIIAQHTTADALLSRLRPRLDALPEYVVHHAARQATVDAIGNALDTGAVDVQSRFDRDHTLASSKMFPVLLDAVKPGSTIANADLFAPVASILRVESIDQGVEIVNRCRYRLSASVFAPHQIAQPIAESLSVGSVVINDLVVPTADPRLPFGGRGASGFGVTRGAEGLLAMTTPKTISVRSGRFLPHLRTRHPTDQARLESTLQWLHGKTWTTRWAALRRMIRPQ